MVWHAAAVQLGRAVSVACIPSSTSLAHSRCCSAVPRGAYPAPDSGAVLVSSGAAREARDLEGRAEVQLLGPLFGDAGKEYVRAAPSAAGIMNQHTLARAP